MLLPGLIALIVLGVVVGACDYVNGIRERNVEKMKKRRMSSGKSTDTITR